MPEQLTTNIIPAALLLKIKSNSSEILMEKNFYIQQNQYTKIFHVFFSLKKMFYWELKNEFGKSVIPIPPVLTKPSPKTRS